MSNSYFGFTTGGTQYTAQGTAYATAAAPTYVAQPTASAAAYATPVAAAPQARAYETYPAAAVSINARQVAAPKPTQVQMGTTYVYSAPSNPRTTYSTTPVTQSSNVTAQGIRQAFITPTPGYEAAVYSAASNYYTAKPTNVPAWKKNQSSGGGGGFKKNDKPKMPPKAPQLHYCEVCKISCAGPQTYKEHLEGQKHKKKEAAQKGGNLVAPAGRGGQHQLRCELCDVTCTGADAYAAHIKGIKHQKVLKLHQRLGKPIPSNEPVIISNEGSKGSSGGASATPAKSAAKPAGPAKKTTTYVSTPKMTFVGGSTLRSTGAKQEEVKAQVVEEPKASGNVADDDTKSTLDMLKEKEVQPVGHEYVEEIKNDVGKVVSFNCKLCDCKFNDPNAKEMHLKGRRHRLAYKKKVDPSLQVEIKPSVRLRKVQEDKMRRMALKEEYWRRRDLEERWREEMRMMEEERYREMEYMQNMQRGGFQQGMRRPENNEDRHVMAKHATIYPTSDELNAIQLVVNQCEKALKVVSDKLAETDPDKETGAPVKQEEGTKPPPLMQIVTGPSKRALKGVMRVGGLAKGLLLKGDKTVDLVVLCGEKPTRSLLQRIADLLPPQIKAVQEEIPDPTGKPPPSFNVQVHFEEAAILVTLSGDNQLCCKVSLTAPTVRDNQPSEGQGEEEQTKDPPDVLDKQKCLDSLAQLRHAKWFQARASNVNSCVIIIRIMKDMANRIPTWSALPQWAIELLVEKCASTSARNVSPGDVLRRVLECVASGILLPGSPGIYDPCEKDPTDALGSVSQQAREDITASAQSALRMVAFRQIHKILDMEPLLTGKFNPRKRRRSVEEGPDAEKKDKKEEDV